MLKAFLKHICEHLYKTKMKKFSCRSNCEIVMHCDMYHFAMVIFLTDTHSKKKRPQIKIWKCIKTHNNSKDIHSNLNQDKQMRSNTWNAAASLNFTTMKCLIDISEEYLTLNWSNKFSAFKSVQLLLDCSNSMIEAECQECLMPWCSWQ